MLNIGRLAPGGEGYYLDTIATGVEDYYLGRGEAPGYWLGHGAEDLGLERVVSRDQLRRVLGGHHPETDEPLAARPNRRVPGFDLTFRAPKSVALVWALGGSEIADQVREAHDAAVAAAVRYVESEVARSRRGRNGTEMVEVDGLTAAAFRHRTSRAGDPLLHTHVLVANLARTSDDGVWRTLDSRRLYIHAKTAGLLYQAHLRDELTRRLGVAWELSSSGLGDIVGVPREVIEAFSQRRAEILEHMERRGETSAKAAQVATLATRRAKTHEVDEASLFDRWRSRAAELGFGPDRIGRLLGRTQARELDDPAGVARIARQLAGPDGLTKQASTFTRRDAIQAWCRSLTAGASVGEVLHLTDALLDPETGRVVDLDDPTSVVQRLTRRDVIRREDGVVIPAGRDARYTTPELLAVEQRLIANALTRRDAGVATVPTRVWARHLAQRPSLSDEQLAMVRRLVSSGAGVEVVVGKAGAGKTFALDAARSTWEAAGVRVTGCALAARAALELESSAGIPSTTIAQLLIDLDHPNGGLARGAVLVIDEAAMVGTRTLARLLDAAAAADAKVVLVGDHHQLPEIDAGGAFRALARRLDAIELTENRRQVEAWEREALDELRHGDPAQAIAAYGAHDRLVVAETAEDVREQLVGDWWRATKQQRQDAVMVALRRSDVADLNARARLRMQAAGELRGPEREAGDVAFQVGDRVLCLRNHRRLRVVNGTRATITHIDERYGSITIEGDDGRAVSLPASYVDAGHLTHGYATTAHKAQGLTVDATFVLGSDELYREWGYTALSRGRHTNRLYLVRAEHDLDRADIDHGATPRERVPVEAAAVALRQSRSEELASEQRLLTMHQRRIRALEERRDDLLSRRRTAAERLAEAEEAATSRSRWRRRSPKAPAPIDDARRGIEYCDQRLIEVMADFERLREVLDPVAKLRRRPVDQVEPSRGRTHTSVKPSLERDLGRDFT